jgi:hypothetical protein
MSAEAAVIEAKLDQVLAILARRESRVAPVLWSAAEADAALRLRDGTVRTWWLAGRVRGQERPGRGRTGKVLYVSAADAEREAIGAAP